MNIVIPPMPSITALAYELAHKAMEQGWDIKIDMNKGTVQHNIHMLGQTTATTVPNE